MSRPWLFVLLLYLIAVVSNLGFFGALCNKTLSNIRQLHSPAFQTYQDAVNTKSIACRLGAAPSLTEKSSVCNIGINGFGRIGRLVLRNALRREGVRVCHINCSFSPEYMSYLLKYDSVHGQLHDDIVATSQGLKINGHQISVSSTRDPGQIPWKGANVEYVCEATGAFCTTAAAMAHLNRYDGAKKVILSAPSKDETTPTLVVGVNAKEIYDPKTMHVVSCASCTTNALAPLIKILDDSYGFDEGLMTTIHAATASQKVVDGTASGGKDWRGGRATGNNIIPSSTGAAKAVARCLPNLKGKLTGLSMRVPTLDVSVVDLTCKLKSETSYDSIKERMKDAANRDYAGIIGYTEDPVVSQDFVGDSRSTIFDASAGIKLNSKFFKLISWYDNEWGYSNRLIDLIRLMNVVDHRKPF